MIELDIKRFDYDKEEEKHRLEMLSGIDDAIQQQLNEQNSDNNIQHMNGGAATTVASFKKYINHSLSDYEQPNNLTYFIVAILIINIIILTIYKNSNIYNFMWKEWYNKFRLFALILDIVMILLVIIFTQIIYNNTFYDEHKFCGFIFILTAILIKVILDMAFYIIVIKQSKPGNNEILDFLKSYSNWAKSRAIYGSVIQIFSITLLAIFISNFSYWISIFLIILSCFIFPLLIFYSK